MRLIDADALRKGIREAAMENDVTVLDVLTTIDFFPTIEAKPVRHGRWDYYEEWGPSTWLEPPDLDNAGWKCTSCGIDLGDYLTECLGEEVYVGEPDKMPKIKSCPHCGAKMDAKEA